MEINASLTGRLRNTTLPLSRALLPLFEGVVNAIESVDAAYSTMDSTKITVEIVRSPQSAFDLDVDRGPMSFDPIVGFVIRDNGEGFNDGNMKSFQTLDSEYKARLGCRGVGRLLWLKAFQKVEVTSRYRDESGEFNGRSFTFSADKGISNHVNEGSALTSTGAEVRLVGFREMYRREAAKSATVIARSIVEHCIWHFVRPGGVPNILVEDGSDRIDLTSVYDEIMLSASESQQVETKGHTFDLVHLRLKAGTRNPPQLYWCAAKRVVLEESLAGKVPGLYGRLKDAEGEFMYSCFVTSLYLDEHVRAERTEFDIPEVTAGGLDEDQPSKSDIRTQVWLAAEKHLLASLDEAKQAGRARVEAFVDNQAPRYRPILRYVDEDKLSVNPDIPDRELEAQLHRYFADIEFEILVEGQEVLNPATSRDEDYDERLRAYLEKVEDAKKSDLAAYVSRRRVILDLFARAIQSDEDGRYAQEEDVHRLIMPMRTSSNDVRPEACNLWMIDESLAFHNYLASDKPISAMPITGSDSRLEPDILALTVNDSPILVAEGENLPLASITVIEFKRPMRSDASPAQDKDPIVQALRYLGQVREGKIKTASGRLIPGSDQIPGFCYVIADLTPGLRECCRYANLRPTQDGLAYFGYNEYYKAYVEVMSFDRLLNRARQRNRAFFDRLGLPAI